MASPPLRSGKDGRTPGRRATLRWVTALAVVFLILAIARWGPMPPLFDAPRSTVLLDRNGELLGASVASDGQWRMPAGDSIPQRFVTCLLEFEDRNFHDHWGVHLPSLVRAFKQNLEAGRTVSGGSTITMQVARMSRGAHRRSLVNKGIEMLLALWIELRYSKAEILALYTDNAPFGGNVVGLEAAAWRWFGREPGRLGWAECATLAVLPNAPSRIHPGRDRRSLKAKRDRLLDRLLEAQHMDTLTWSLAREEPLPELPRPVPRSAPHLLHTLRASGLPGKRIHTTIDGLLQARVRDAAERHGKVLRANEVHNAAVLVLEVPTGEVLAYLGNLPLAGADHAGEVDIVRAPRSTGSLLKPFLHAAMLQQGERMPEQLVADIPTRYQGFAPRNYDEQFTGAIPASTALARSLNVPAVRALHEHGVDRALRMLRSMGLHHLDRSAADYGLSLIVGGSESTLWELTGAYASLARIVLQGPTAEQATVHPPKVLRHEVITDTRNGASPPVGAAAAYHTLAALRSLDRAETFAGWEHFASSLGIAWKTGTSFGHRDAWAIGVTDRYAVGVWTGNASGEGRPALTGTLAAAPLLFEVFGMLPNGDGFDMPYDLMQRMPVCRSSGHRANSSCAPVDTLWILREGLRTDICPYHRTIWVDANGTQRVRPGSDDRPASWFVLPPAMEHFRAVLDPTYRPLPPWAAGAHPDDALEAMELMYPEPGGHILVPILLSGQHGRVVLQAAHRDPNATIHWDVDGEHQGSTRSKHDLPIEPEPGSHWLTLTDQDGRSLKVPFTVERSSSNLP